MQWRLLDLPPLTAAENMALDEVLLEIRGSGRSQDTLRFLQFKPATVLVGFHQSIQEEIRLSYCRKQGIDINRRITAVAACCLMKTRSAGSLSATKPFLAWAFPTPICFAACASQPSPPCAAWALTPAFRPRNDIEVAGRKISGTGRHGLRRGISVSGYAAGGF